MKELKRYLLAGMIVLALGLSACKTEPAPKADSQVETEDKMDEETEDKMDGEESEEKSDKTEGAEERAEMRQAYIETTNAAFSEEYTELEHGDSPEIGQLALDFTVKTVDGSDKEVKLDQILASGELVQLNFFTTSCRYCVAEMPDLVELNKRDDIKVVVIGAGEKPITLKRFVEGQYLDIPIFSDEKGDASRAYLVSGVPVNYYIKNGKIVGKLMGAWSSAVLNYVADELNAGNPMPDNTKLQEVYDAN